MALLNPTGKPGEYEIGGRTIQIVSWREGDVYDTDVLAPGAVAAGTQMFFFRDIAGKSLQHTNLKTPRRLPSDSELIVSRIGVYIMQCVGVLPAQDLDIIQAAHCGYFFFKVGERMVSEAPLIALQTGLGCVGSTTRNNTGVVTVGVASLGAAPNLLVAQPIATDRDLESEIDFLAANWLNGAAAPYNLGANRFPSFSTTVGFQVYLHGFIKIKGGSN